MSERDMVARISPTDDQQDSRTPSPETSHGSVQASTVPAQSRRSTSAISVGQSSNSGLSDHSQRSASLTEDIPVSGATPEGSVRRIIPLEVESSNNSPSGAKRTSPIDATVPRLVSTTEQGRSNWSSSEEGSLEEKDLIEGLPSRNGSVERRGEAVVEMTQPLHQSTDQIQSLDSSSAREKVRVNPALGGSLSDTLSFGSDGVFGTRLRNNRQYSTAVSINTAGAMSVEDIEICQRLDDEYERALEEREIGYNARYHSVRQSACFSVSFMVVYLFVGVMFFTQYSGWKLNEALFYSVYTITTVGYGSDKIPTDTTFQVFTIGFIFVGIATLTIMVAQVYQCIALEATRAQHARDKAEMARRGSDGLASSEKLTSMRMRSGAKSDDDELGVIPQKHCSDRVLDSFVSSFEQSKAFFRDSEIGRGISIVFPMGGLILVGAVVVGPLEGWSVVESLYFACVTMTTVGYGVYVPDHPISLWFCVFWLPFSVGFMSIFLGNVASFYIRLSDKNIHRVERQMRRRIQMAKLRAEQERAEILERAYRGQAIQLGSEDDGDTSTQSKRRRPGKRGFNAVPTDNSVNEEASGESKDDVLFGSSEFMTQDDSSTRRRRILENSNYHVAEDLARPQGQTMQSMRDILRAIKANRQAEALGTTDGFNTSMDDPLSVRSIESLPSHSMGPGRRRERLRKPSFALRVLVQERFAEIISTDIAGFQSHIEIKENTLSVTIETLKQTADKWLVPRRARKAFRAVAFEALYFVGEHGLITRGADALYDLSPFEFHGLFSPLLAAMGDAGTMESWLASTNVLADVDLRRDGTRPGLSFIQGQTPPTVNSDAGAAERLRRAYGNDEHGASTPRLALGLATNWDKELS